MATSLPAGRILTSVARVPVALLDQGEALGLDRRALMNSAGLDAEALSDPDARIGLAVVWELWRAIIESSGDPDLGLTLGQGIGPDGLGVVGYSLKYSDTIGRALERLQRYSQIVTQSLRVDLAEREGRVELSLARDAPFEALRHPIDARLVSLVAMTRALSQSELDPREVRFPYAAPENLHAYRQFFRAPLTFDADAPAIVFHPSDLARPVVTADETLDRYLDSYADQLLADLGRSDSVTQAVLRTLWGQLSGGKLSLGDVADRLAMSPRTLQRRLREESTTFGKLLDQFRREASLRLVKERTLSIEEVAFMLGYSEPSTFYRAFRRWTGETPRGFRHAR